MKPAERHLQRIGGWAGMIVAPLAWFGAQQLAFYLTGINCQNNHWIAPLLNLAGAVLALAFGWLSYRSLGRAGSEAASDQRARFVASIGAFIPLFFALALVWQAIAGFVYSGCEH